MLPDQFKDFLFSMPPEEQQRLIGNMPEPQRNMVIAELNGLDIQRRAEDQLDNYISSNVVSGIAGIGGSNMNVT